MLPAFLEKLSAANWLQHFSFTSDGKLLMEENTPQGAVQMYPFGTSRFVGWMEQAEQGYRIVCEDAATKTVHVPALAPLPFPVPPCLYGEEHIVGLHLDSSGVKKLVLAHYSNEEDLCEWLELPDAQAAGDLHPAVAPRRRAIVVTRRTTGPYTELVLVEPELNRWRVLLAGEGNMTPVCAQWNPDETELACLVRRGRRLAAVVLDVETLKSRALAVPPLAEAPVWNPDGRSLLLTLDEWPWTKFASYDLATDQVAELELLPHHLLSSPRWQAGELYFKAVASDEPPALFRWSQERSEVERLTPEQGFPPLAPPEVVGIETERGYSIPCLVFAPDVESQRAVYFLHGGPSGAWNAAWHPLIQLLVSEGLRVILVNPRGSTVRNWPLPPLRPGEFGKADVQDVIDCIREGVRRGWACPGQVGLYGHSYGGQLAVRAAQELGAEIGAVLLTSSYLDVSMLKNSRDPAVRRFAEYAFVPEELESAEGNAAWTVPCPLLQVHGEQDMQLPVEDATAAYDRRGGSRHELLILQGEGHDTRHRSNVCAWIERGVEFLRGHLKG